MPAPLDVVQNHMAEFYRPKRKAVSSRFPVLVKPATFTKKALRGAKNRISLRRLEQKGFMACVIARHSSLLYRKLGDSDPDLQMNKVVNIARAIRELDGLVIPPGEVFSFWHAVGAVNEKRGYVDGMLLSNGRPSRGMGGGLCQLSNFLFWILMHADTEIVERHHHSVDAFPDSGRTLPFGSGATVFSNYLDLKVKNISDRPLQIKLWLTASCLKGQILSDAPGKKKFHLAEKNHCFIRQREDTFRYNEICRETYEKGIKSGEEKILTNFAPVIYPVSQEYLLANGYEMVRVDRT